jgi:hypothetical protein
VELDEVSLTYADARHDVANYPKARGWDTVVATNADLVAVELPALQGNDLERVAASAAYARATRK